MGEFTEEIARMRESAERFDKAVQARLRELWGDSDKRTASKRERWERVESMRNLIKGTLASTREYCEQITSMPDSMRRLMREFDKKQESILETPERSDKEQASGRMDIGSTTAVSNTAAVAPPIHARQPEPQQRGVDGIYAPGSLVYQGLDLLAQPGHGRWNAPPFIKSTSEKQLWRHFMKNGVARWEASDQRAQLMYILSAIPYIPPVEKIVGFALGSMMFGLRSRKGDPGPLLQHALMLTLRESLEARAAAAAAKEAKGTAAAAIKCYAQDPAYEYEDEDEDEKVLRGVGITVLEEDDGFKEVDSKTVVFSQFPSFHVRQAILDRARPAMMIWRKVEREFPDDPCGGGSFQPDVHIYTSTKVPWVEIPSSAEVYEEFDEYAKVWGEEVCQRLSKMLKKIKKGDC
ncbi:hypothetical protein B0H66DRAFT_621396 [Apodospora peruviana]|uniref:SRR1-like domain-containing protein n=1 Tax=Apodospora peruviana TaxID=516989 RepID=A0AAE0HSA6_9PEZI|nr:hypothetical protein B0H66DRAFT_618266 [Apodospora peruviana]KAK3317943.1 hypothetical protein B0H66DRAFT_621396 [Apodospora peruviana]